MGGKGRKNNELDEPRLSPEVHERTRGAKTGLHIGLPKTGTSSLQQLCFARHSQICYFGQSNVWTSAEAQIMLKALLLPEGLRPSDDEVKVVLEAAAQSKPALMISDEALSFGAFMLRARSWPVVSDHDDIARRAKYLLGSVHVFLVLRNQVDWLESWHRQGLKSGKYIERHLDRWLGREIGEKTEQLFSALDYGALYRPYANIFGPENVHVRLYEHHKADFGKLAADFADVLNADPVEAAMLMNTKPKNVTGTQYKSLPLLLQRFEHQQYVRDLLKRVPKRARSVFSKCVKVKRPYVSMNDDLRKSIREHFAQSNRTLMDKLAIDADGLGYF